MDNYLAAFSGMITKIPISGKDTDGLKSQEEKVIIRHTKPIPKQVLILFIASVLMLKIGNAMQAEMIGNGMRCYSVWNS
jgi:hypothetical protein